MKKIETILRWIGAIVIIICLGWLAYTFKFNIGGLVSGILGEKKKRKKAIVDTSGKIVGVSTPILTDKNPLRDRTKVTLESGDVVQLPTGIKDTDVRRVVKIGIDEYSVEVQHEAFTSVFDTD